MDRTVDEILDDLIETGQMPCAAEVVDLCAMVAELEIQAARYEAVAKALRRAGWSVLDTTTDDDDGTVIELVPPRA